MLDVVGLGAGFAFVPVLGMVSRAKTVSGRALLQPLRAKLLNLLHHRPGLRLTQLWKAMGAPRGTILYHLFVLERVGAVESIHGAGVSRYFPKDTPHINALSLLLRGRILDVADMVQRRPGSSQSELIERLGMNRKLFRSYANLLIEAGLLAEERGWRIRKYFATKHLEDVLARFGSLRPSATIEKEKVASVEGEAIAGN